jgi:hypothetical protein
MRTPAEIMEAYGLKDMSSADWNKMRRAIDAAQREAAALGCTQSVQTMAGVSLVVSIVALFVSLVVHLGC